MSCSCEGFVSHRWLNNINIWIAENRKLLLKILYSRENLSKQHEQILEHASQLISFASSQIFDARLADQHMIDEGKKNAICNLSV